MSSFSRPDSKERVLIVDDAAETLEVLQRNLTAQGYAVLSAQSVAEAVSILESAPVDLVITDLKMPGASGLELIREVREHYKDTEIMMITGYATIEGAVEAMKIGASEYLAKPFTQEDLRGAVEKALNKVRARKAQLALLAPSDDLLGLLGTSETMKTVFAAVRKAAAGQVPVYIEGERGTGKTSLARVIHHRGPRSTGPFIHVSCQTVPEELLDRELFGLGNNASSGSEEGWKGFLRLAEGGTLYLSEVGGLSHALQGKLLRTLRDREGTVGSSPKQPLPDVRIIASSTRDMGPMLDRNLFREDLFYRLSVLTIRVPPLRERGEDAIALACHVLERFSYALGRPAPGLSDAARELLRAYTWPGNVAELQDTLWRVLCALDGDVLDTAHIPDAIRRTALTRVDPLRPLAEVEADYVDQVLASVQGNKTRAADILGIDRKTLRDRLKARDPGR